MKKIATLVCCVVACFVTGAAQAQTQPEGGSTITVTGPASSAPAGNPCGSDPGCNAALAQCRADLSTATTSSANLVAALATCQGNLKKAVPAPPARRLPPPPTCRTLDDDKSTPDDDGLQYTWAYWDWRTQTWVCGARDSVLVPIANLRTRVANLEGRAEGWDKTYTLVRQLTVYMGQPGPQFSSAYADIFTWIESAEARLQRIAEIDRWIQETLVPWMLMHDRALGALCPPVESCSTNDLACRCEYAAKHGKGSRVDVSLGARGLVMHRPGAGAAGGVEGYGEIEVRIPGTSTSVVGDVGAGVIGDADTGTQFTTSQTVAIRQYLGSEERTSLDLGPSFRQYFSTHSAGYQGVLQDKGMGMEIDGRLQLRHCFTAAACVGLGGYLGGSPTTNYFPQPGEVARDKGLTGGGFLSLSGVVTNF